MKHILLTGFEPFGGETVNPSLEAVRRLRSMPVPGIRLSVDVLPVVFADVILALDEAITEYRPDAVIAVGQAGSRSALSVERIAINVIDARIPDNAGAQPVDAPVVPGGPAAYFATIPVKAMVSLMRAAGAPAEVSQTAGTFVCNAAFYALQYLAATRHPGLRGGFVHVPFLPEQAARHPGAPSMALETIAAGLRAAVEAVRDTGQDLLLAEGRTD